MHSLKLRKEIELKRTEGFSPELLAKLYSVPRGTVYYWVKDIPLSDTAKEKLRRNTELGRTLGQEQMQIKRRTQLDEIVSLAGEQIGSIQQTIPILKLICAIFFWAEGAKMTKSVRFINSDPKMIKTFLSLFRRAFTIDEKKFRVNVHIHQYHNDDELKTFWSEVTSIPLTQFNKSYRKTNTGKTKKAGYQGCASIYYYDAKIAKELTALYNALYPWALKVNLRPGPNT